jgi:lipoate-protein ligase A
MASCDVRLLPFAQADGPHNMAADEVLLHSAARGQASLRFYGWSQPTVSLGYFQPEARRLEDPLLRALPFVRRPTGGDALAHHHELTYCLAVPAKLYRRSGEPWCGMHTVIAAALADLGIAAHLHCPAASDSFAGFLCFQHFTAGDLIVNGSKVVGSAQRRQRGAILQHGGILLATSPCTPSLPGLRERTGVELQVESLSAAIVRHLAAQTRWCVQPGNWTDEERAAIEKLATDRYRSGSWNAKR